MNDIVVEVIRKINRARRKLEYIQRSQQLEELIWSPHKSFSISRASKNNFESKITFVSDVADDWTIIRSLLLSDVLAQRNEVFRERYEKLSSFKIFLCAL